MSAANNRRPQPSALGPDTILIYALVDAATPRSGAGATTARASRAVVAVPS